MTIYKEFKVFKVTAVPSTYGQNEIYYVKKPSSDYLELYCTNVDGTKIFRMPTIEDFNNIVFTAITNSTNMRVVDTIDDRDAINPKGGRVYVIDATADNTVDSGGAEYLYDTSTTSWIKISETESMDLVLLWNQITGKPTSSANDIDAAVSNSHTHENMSTLNKLSQDSDGRLMYNNKVVANGWTDTQW